jgi:hypothetical protein
MQHAEKQHPRLKKKIKRYFMICVEDGFDNGTEEQIGRYCIKYSPQNDFVLTMELL